MNELSIRNATVVGEGAVQQGAMPVHGERFHSDR
jgi:hypothetical protein